MGLSVARHGVQQESSSGGAFRGRSELPSLIPSTPQSKMAAFLAAFTLPFGFECASTRNGGPCGFHLHVICIYIFRPAAATSSPAASFHAGGFHFSTLAKMMQTLPCFPFSVAIFFSRMFAVAQPVRQLLLHQFSQVVTANNRVQSSCFKSPRSGCLTASLLRQVSKALYTPAVSPLLLTAHQQSTAVAILTKESLMVTAAGAGRSSSSFAWPSSARRWAAA